jgi:hypothetical protein
LTNFKFKLNFIRNLIFAIISIIWDADHQILLILEKIHFKFFIARDYTEIPGRTSGEGVKMTKAWEATITPNQLQQKRQEFWVNLRVNNRSSCLVLKQAVDADAASAKLMLEMEGFILENGTMEKCLSPNGHRYEIPPFVLVDPIRFIDPKNPVIVKKVLKEEVIKVKLRTVFTNSEDEFEISNSVIVKDLKRMYLDKHPELNDIRFFFGGKELTDNSSIMSFGIESDMVIQVNKRS